jgi:chromosome segregation ATPase
MRLPVSARCRRVERAKSVTKRCGGSLEQDLQQQLGVARAMGGSARRGGGGDMEGSESTVTSGADMARMAALETELAERQGKITELGLRVMELEGDLESVAALHRYEVAELSREAAKARQQADELRSAAQSGSAAADDQTRDLRATLRTQTAAAAAAAEKAAAHVKQLETKVEALQTTADEVRSTAAGDGPALRRHTKQIPERRADTGSNRGGR